MSSRLPCPAKVALLGLLGKLAEGLDNAFVGGFLIEQQGAIPRIKSVVGRQRALLILGAFHRSFQVDLAVAVGIDADGKQVVAALSVGLRQHALAEPTLLSRGESGREQWQYG
jgi:hypothetical protein